MAREINRLTPRAVAAAKVRGLYPDGGNLYLQVGATGGKSWLFRYMLNGKALNMGMGSITTITLAEARLKAADARKMLLNGFDPRIARDAEKAERLAGLRKIKTFREAARECIQSKAPEWKNEKHAQQWGNTLATYAFPYIGDMDVRDIGVPDVLKVLTPIWACKPETASRVRMRLEAVLNYCRELRNGQPNPAEWRGNLDAKLAKPAKVKKVKQRPALPFVRVQDFLAEVRKQGTIGALALEFQILCASRPGEVRWATWGEFDLEKGVWLIPGERMKAHRAHEVPLTKQTIELLKKLPRFAESDYVFTANGKKPISENAANQVIKQMNQEALIWTDPHQGHTPIVAHGFRSTFRDWAGETTNFPREVIEHALAHQLKNKAEAAYARGTLMPKRRALMEAWSLYCNTTPCMRQVVPLSKGAA